MRTFKSSVAIVALVTVVVLLIIAMGLIQIVLFTSLNTQRNAEITRGKWFLEGRVEEYMDGLLTGNRTFATGNFPFQEPIDGTNQEYRFAIARQRESYSLDAEMRWKNKYPLHQHIDFSRLNPFGYALFFDKDAEVTIADRLIVDGSIAVRGSLTVNRDGGDVFFRGRGDSGAIVYDTEPPSIPGSVFTDSTAKLIDSPIDTFSPFPVNTDLSAYFKKSKALRDLSLPDFQTLAETYLKYKDDRWVLENFSVGDTVSIANYMDVYKELVAFGDGFSTHFPVRAVKPMYVYVKRVADNLRYQKIDSFDYAYYFGIQNRDQFYHFDDRTLYLTASEGPVETLLDETSYRTFGYYYLSGEKWSYLSLDERVKDVYFDTPDVGHNLVEGIDFVYDRAQKGIRITADAYYKQYVLNLGTGDGNKREFPFVNPGGRIYIYIGSDRTIGMSSFGTAMMFDQPVPYGLPVRVLVNPPNLYIRKAPPASGTGIFIDRSQKVLVLDLSTIQNYPSHGVIFAAVPVLLKGTPREPLAIIGFDNVYIQSINPTDDGKPMGAPVFVASKTGVWIYRSGGQYENEINRCVIYTPLDSINTVFESGEVGNPSVTIYGSVLFAGTYPGQSMNPGYFGKNFIYCPDLAAYLDREPFSIFPLPINIQTVRRF